MDTAPGMAVSLSLLAAVLAGCGGGGAPAAGGSEPAAYGLTERITVSTLAFPDAGPSAGNLRTLRAFPGLSFEAPLVFAAVPGRPRAAVATQGGRVYEFAEDDEASSAELVLDLSDRTAADGEQGLLGLAYDPDYARNGRVYAYYVDLRTRNPGTSVIARFQADAAGRIDRASETRLLSFDQPYANHNGGAIAFGPDGHLYIASGDGGSSNDPDDNAQNLSVLLGKILRIAADGSVPADNPFVATPGARGEIWAYGLRNPFRMSFDRVTGELWAGDVGQSALEEIDVIVQGGNYGWPLYEGERSNKNPQNRPASDFIAPVFTYGRDQGVSVTGGVVYRGGALPQLAGHYVYGDFGSGRLWALATDVGGAVANTELANLPGPSGLGEDAHGEIMITAYDGALYRLQAVDDGAGFPQQLSQTGLFADLATLQAMPGLIEYDVNAPFWSDGAHKRRWIALPGSSKIGFSADAAWSFPLGSVIVKHFELRLADGRDRRLETRVLIHASGGWQGHSYRWNEAGTDAELLTTRQTVELTVPDASAPGGTRLQTYEFPASADCLRCHTAAAGSVLGLRSAQLNRSFDYGAVSDNQLRSFDHIALFDRAIGAPASYPALPDPYAAAAGTAARARAYLDSNCAHCHRPGGPVPTDMDLRASTATAQLNTHGVAPTQGDLGIADARRIAPGDRTRSLLWERMRRLDDTRMPPLASHAVDAAGVELIGAWIDAGAE